VLADEGKGFVEECVGDVDFILGHLERKLQLEPHKLHVALPHRKLVVRAPVLMYPILYPICIPQRGKTEEQEGANQLLFLLSSQIFMDKSCNNGKK
jgi:hypothetical protein